LDSATGGARREEQVSCPICGMALEPVTPAAGDAENRELRDMTRHLWVGLALRATGITAYLANGGAIR